MTRAYVTARRDEDALESALALRQALDAYAPETPLVVALSRAHGVGKLISDASAKGNLKVINIDMFPALEEACTAEFVKGGSFEPFAIALHNRWRQTQFDNGRSGEEVPGWAELDEPRRESSRAQARHISTKVQKFGYAIVPLEDWNATEFTFESDEVEQLARDEHDRWNEERRTAGWTLRRGLPADPVKKLTPHLVPFDELDPDVAQWDRDFVLVIPRVLASAGLQIKKPPAQADPGPTSNA